VTLLQLTKCSPKVKKCGCSKKAGYTSNSSNSVPLEILEIAWPGQL
jgi:hypothetical protein